MSKKRNQKNSSTVSTLSPKPDLTLSTPVVPSTFDDAKFKTAFYLISALILISMPLLSTQYGVTADEWANKSYGELCLDYFTSFGKVKDAIKYAPQGGEVMYCYGPTLDVISAAIYRTFNFSPYLIRHILLSLMGALIMISGGLAGKIVGKNWRA